MQKSKSARADTDSILWYDQERSSIRDNTLRSRDNWIADIVNQKSQIRKNGDQIKKPIAVYLDAQILAHFSGQDEPIKRVPRADMILEDARRELLGEERQQVVERIAEKAILMKLERFKSQYPEVHLLWTQYEGANTASDKAGWPSFWPVGYQTLHATLLRHWLITSEPFDDRIDRYFRDLVRTDATTPSGDFRMNPGWWIDHLGFFDFEHAAPTSFLDGAGASLSTSRQWFWDRDEAYFEWEIERTELEHQMPTLVGAARAVALARLMRWKVLIESPELADEMREKTDFRKVIFFARSNRKHR